MSEYKKLLRHPFWQRKRLEIMQRDNWRCIRCGDREKELNVHHRKYTYGLKPWEYDNSLLVTVCVDCHKNAHGDFPVEIVPKSQIEATEKVKGIVVSWLSWEAEGYAQYEFIPWTGRKVCRSNGERNVIFICLDKKLNEFAVDEGSARAFLFPKALEVDQGDFTTTNRTLTNAELFYWLEGVHALVKDGVIQELEA